ncbi:sulfite exporter TauE/SafE family protein, partial [Salmonella enterica subsp. enterica]|nr:sulfite exporter TauE/SafE family protein [Salmonella enterica subsp. enterica]
FGFNIHEAISASIVSVIACSCASAPSFLKGRLTNIRLAIILEVATTSGALTGVLMAGLVTPPVLYSLFAIILLISAKQMLAPREERIQTRTSHNENWMATLRLQSSFHDHQSGKDVPYHVDRISSGMGLMFGAGLVSALLGIGSGVLKIPAMDTALRLPLKVSSATSNFMIGVTGTASAAACYIRGDMRMDIAGPVALGAVVGAFVGARALIVISTDKLRIFFVIVLILLAIQMMLSALGIQLPGNAL